MLLKKVALNTNISLAKKNKKLRPTNFVKWIILSLPSRTTCPYATELCKKNCYACKAEASHFKGVHECRVRQYEESLKDSWVQDMINWIEYMINSKSYKGKRIYVRLHESGDIYSIEYYFKLLAITRYFEKDYPNVKFGCYTKSVQFVAEDINLPSNFVIRYSVWSDTAKNDIELAAALELPIYTACKEEEIEAYRQQDYYICKCDCTLCKACYFSEFKKIACVIH